MLSSRLFTQRLRQQTLRQCFQFPLSHVVCDRKSLHHSASILSSSSNVNTLDTNDKSEGVGSSSSRNNQGFECVYDELEARGFIQQTTNQVELRKCLKESISVYAGFDPTADSLHVGNLVVLMTLLHFQRYGHRPICLVGGATGMIGDPSGRNSERNMMQQDTLDRNLEGIKRSLAQILTFEDGSTLSSPPSSSARLPSPGSPATLVNNLDWYKDMNILDFLRDYGQHFRLGQMLNKDSVTSRLNSEAGMSFLEFSYSTLQSTDFLTLYRSHACRLQIGGSDQWGNIVLGTDLVKKSTQGEREGEKATEGEGEVEGEVEGDKVFGLTVPLLATSTGEKFGKSAGNALWLDESKTSPYQLYQYFFNADDADVERFLKLFTLLPLTEIDSIVQTHQGSLHERTGQQALATQVVHLIHGEAGVESALRCTEALFGGGAGGASLQQLTQEEVHSLFLDGEMPVQSIPRAEFSEMKSLVEVVFRAGAAPSKGKARKLIQQGGIYLNHTRVKDISYAVGEQDLLQGGVCVVRAGKKSNFVLHVKDE